MIEELKSATMIGYACINSAQFTRADIEQIQNTKAYTDIVEQFHQHFLDPTCIRVDVIAGPTRKRYWLEEIIDTFKTGDNWYQSPKGVLVIASPAALGSRPDIASTNYLRLVQEDIGILVLEEQYQNFSTVDFGGAYNSQPEQRVALAGQLRQTEIKAKRGAKRVDRIFTPGFKEIYWLFENYFITEALVYSNTINGEISHGTFNRYCADYERSIDYAEDEAKQLANGIEQKPKRFGRPPAKFPEYCSRVIDGELTIEEASHQLGITPVTFKRYILKGTGRQAMWDATAAYKRQDIIEKITPKE